MTTTRLPIPSFLHLALAAGAGVLAVPALAAPCGAPGQGAPLFVTADCVDPQFSQPVIDNRTELAAPFPHLKVAGHFKGTQTTFTIYLPHKDAWQGRFYQNVYPMTPAEAPEASLLFARNHGAYTVQTQSAGGYRSDAAAAKFAKTVARAYYGEPQRRIFGYVFGGSGGSYQTIGAIENTSGVWDGAVPFVVGAPTSIPNNFFVRTLARLVLAGKAEQIADAVRPGGSGDPYAGLDATERAVLAEVSALGVPLRGWDDYAYLLGLKDKEGLLGFRGTVKAMDPGYAADFWRLPGYLGTAQSDLGDRVRAARVRQTNAVGAIARDRSGTPTGFILAEPAPPNRGFVLDATLLGTNGRPVAALAGLLDPATNIVTLAAGNAPAVLAAIQGGARLQLDNDWSVALSSYHRHQVPADRSFTAWDQFRDGAGQPVYPQRAHVVGPSISLNVTGGGAHTGKILGKVIAISNLLDVDAYPWHGDWYAAQVRQHAGAAAGFRLWLNDNADHLDGEVIASGTTDTSTVRLVSYVGIVQQAVLDVSAWVEQGIAPAPSTAYTLDHGQVALAGAFAARGGTQPDVRLLANGQAAITVAAGQPVTLQGTATVQPGTGFITQAAWSPLGSDAFVPAALPGQDQGSVTVSTTVTYPRPGVYYPVLRVGATRAGAPAPHGPVANNLARVRVTVQ